MTSRGADMDIHSGDLFVNRHALYEYRAPERNVPLPLSFQASFGKPQRLVAVATVREARMRGARPGDSTVRRLLRSFLNGR